MIKNFNMPGLPDKMKNDLLQAYYSASCFNDWAVSLFGEYAAGIATEFSLRTIDHWSEAVRISDLSKAVQQLGSNDVGLIHYLSFVGKYLKIDLRPYLHLVPIETKMKVLGYIGEEASALFYFDEIYDSPLLRESGVDKQRLANLTSRLISDGGILARSKRPIRIDI